jgi:uncharacterized membrane protein YphA (DoxX/SURF4 family)
LQDPIENNLEKSIVYLCLRIIVGTIFIYHGINKFANKQKLSNWTKFIHSQKLPSWLAITSAIIEVGIGVMLLLGFCTKLSSIIGILFMLIALYLGHRNDKQVPVYQIAIMLMLFILFLSGPGKFYIIKKTDSSVKMNKIF